MSAYETQSKPIGEYTYNVTLLGAKAGIRVMLKVLKSVAPVFLVAAAAGSLQGLDVGRVTGALKDLSEDDFEWVCAQLAEKTTVTMGEKSPALYGANGAFYDMHFAGRYSALLEWLEFAVEVNFAGFFGDLKRRNALAKAAPGSSVSPPPST